MLPDEDSAVVIKTAANGNCQVIAAGRLGWDTGTKIRHELAGLAGTDWTKQTVVVNLAEVSLLDSAGMSALLTLRQELIKGGGKLGLCNTPPRIHQMFELVGMYRLVTAGENFETTCEAMTL